MEFTVITFDQIILAAMACVAIREVMIMALPNSVAGPGGWLVNTGQSRHRQRSLSPTLLPQHRRV
jgi:hypothetical protein